MLSILLAAMSAFASALNMVTQHVASTAAPAAVKGWRLLIYLVRNPLWLFGVAAMVVGFFLQALALYKGRISVVQSILVTELVFSLVIARVWLRRRVRSAAWISASVTSAGLALFLVMSEPQGGHPGATAAAWLPALLALGGLTALCVFLARGASAVGRAAFYASGAGITGALFATFVKSASDTLGSQGVLAMLRQGPVYGLIVTGVAGTLLTQAALHWGPLAVSQPLIVIVNPVVSILLGVWIYGEHFVGGGGKIAAGAIGFLAMTAGVVALARTAPSLATTKPPG
jgi:drug/metabolite transporter (DMT)-like permease